MNNLTICIPTYNRAPFLAWTLNKTLEGFPESRILVSDDGSTDQTDDFIEQAEAAKLRGFRYIKQPRNIGPFPNMRAALLASSSKYCVFLGDDDYLLPEEVAKGVEFLEKNPHINCYYAPCQLYDEVNGKPEWDAFYKSEDETFDHSGKLWNFLMANHVWPEHAIYRRKGLERIIQPRIRPYWCFVDLGNAAMCGPIHFAKTPYYRNITKHPVGHRGKLGDAQCLTDFEEYRSGLELLAYAIFAQHLKDNLQLKVDINNGIRQFIFQRLEVARRIYMAQGKTMEAAILERRMIVTGF